MMDWSPEQFQAIHQLGKNLIVSASAGSGKTAVLTARMAKRIIEDQIELENLLAMTFTDAAASEMKSRLFHLLSDTMNSTSDPQLKAYCAQQCAVLSSALICTIHSFCLDVITKNYFVIGLDPGLTKRIFTEDELNIMKDSLMEQTLSQLQQKNKQDFIKTAQFFSGRSDDFSTMKKAIFTLAEAALASFDPTQYLDKILTLARQPARFDLIDKTTLYYFFLKIELDMHILEKQLEQLLLISIHHGLEEEYVAPIHLKLGKLQPIFEAIKQQNYNECLRILGNMATSNLKSNSKNEAYKKLRTTINKNCQNLVASYFDADTLFYDNKHNEYLVSFLVSATQLFITLFQKEKQQLKGIDFNDMEHLAFRILKARDGQVAQQYRERFAEILVDEFQDTNTMQNEMIEMISHGNNIFRVGDVKQSIYRFRGAKPEIMAKLMDKQDEHSELIVLHHNYRSNKSIIEYNNYLFERLMSIDGLNNTFTKVDYALAGTPSQDDLYHYPVEFLKISADSQSESTSRIKKANPKAIVLAEKILEMKETTKFKKWSDYCVLVRSHAIKDEIRFVFDQLNIPYTAVLQTGFFKTHAVQIVVSYLRLILWPHQDIACIAVLTGLYHYSDEQCSQLQLQRQKNSYFDAVSKLDPLFAEDFNQICHTFTKNGICAALSKIYNIHHFYKHHLNNQERANLDLFLQKAHDFENNFSSLKLFLDQIDGCYDMPSSTAVAASRSDNVVQITTVHQSKGLQYPVVFYWSSMRTTINDDREALLVDEEMGLGLYHMTMPYRFRRPTMTRTAITMKNTLEEYAENVRLYYVALTRAQQKCFILDKIPENYTPIELSLMTFFQRKGCTDLILSAMNQAVCPFYCESNIELSDTHQMDMITTQTQSQSNKIILYPQKDQIIYKIESPSSYEEPTLPQLTFHQPTGSARGIHFHTTIEHLPTPPWTFEMIQQVNPNLSKLDIESLIILGKNEFFISLFHQKYYHEYTFATLHQDLITRGAVDFISIGQNDITLIDFKSDRGLSKSDLIYLYKPQVIAYQKNIHQIYPDKKIKVYLYSLTLNCFIEINT